jgi:hypothetical protein
MSVQVLQETDTEMYFTHEKLREGKIRWKGAGVGMESAQTPMQI